MDTIALLLAFGLILSVKSIYDGRKAKAELVKRLKNEWGEVPQETYSSEKMESIRKYFQAHYDIEQDIDDITFHDLDLKQIYYLLNNTGSAIGEEYLYALLRKPVIDEIELQKRERTITFFSEHDMERTEFQKILMKLGKLNKLSVYEYLNRTDDIVIQRPWLHLVSAMGLLSSIVLIFIIPSLGISMTAIFLVVNILSYYKCKGQIEQYISLFSYIVRLLQSLDSLHKLKIPELQDELTQMKEMKSVFRGFSRNANLVGSANVGTGDFAELLLDYVRMLFHVDIIKFNSMLIILRKNRDLLNSIYEKVGFLDSMIAVASFRQLLPQYAIPEFISGPKVKLHAKGLYHPLLEEPVPNSINVEQSVLLTGSNASGKSTFLKTLAINAILAQAFNTSVSEGYQATRFRVFSSMALKDDIFQNESYYIVEIKSLKRILDRLNGEIPVLCFVDEVLRGTNTIERIAASAQILQSLASGNALCVAATHDIELTHILEHTYLNYHFTEQVEGDQILFDYHLYPGRSTTKNAIRLLGMMGYPDVIIEEATNFANDYLEKGSWEVLPETKREIRSTK